MMIAFLKQTPKGHLRNPWPPPTNFVKDVPRPVPGRRRAVLKRDIGWDMPGNDVSQLRCVIGTWPSPTGTGRDVAHGRPPSIPAIRKQGHLRWPFLRGRRCGWLAVGTSTFGSCRNFFPNEHIDFGRRSRPGRKAATSHDRNVSVAKPGGRPGRRRDRDARSSTEPRDRASRRAGTWRASRRPR